MKVYVLSEQQEEGIDISAIYSSMEIALAALPYSSNLKESDIQEFELDPKNEGEIYEEYFYVNIDPNVNVKKYPGTKDQDIIWGGSYKMKPSEVKPYKFVRCESLARTTGYGKTYEEAKSNSEKAQLELHPIWQVGKYSNNEECAVHHPHPSTIYPWAVYGLHEDYNVAKIALDDYLHKGIVSEYLRIV